MTRRRTVMVVLALAAACGTDVEWERRPAAIIAHRGASGYAPEHTFAAYDMALAMGADFIEQDLQMTRDSVLVVLHDESLDRTAQGPDSLCSGAVASRTAADLATCDVGTWYHEAHPDATDRDYSGARVPRLEEVFRRYGDTVRYYIETKQPDAAPGMEERLLELLGEFDLLPDSAGDFDVIVQSFSPASLQRLRTLNRDLPLVQLIGRGEVPESLDEAMETIGEYAIGVGPAAGDVDQEFVDTAHRHGLMVHPYTVNEMDEMSRLMQIGVDGMFTDFPNRLYRIRR